MRAAKIDANHGAIVDALRAAGCFVQSLAKIGGGCPDILAARGGVWHVIEVKDIGGRLTPAQKVWHRDSAPHARTHIAYTVADALLIVGIK
jgi:hypothetical protein